jgi:hypothetical protein
MIVLVKEQETYLINLFVQTHLINQLGNGNCFSVSLVITLYLTILIKFNFELQDVSLLYWKTQSQSSFANACCSPQKIGRKVDRSNYFGELY